MAKKTGRPTKMDAARSAKIVQLIRAGNYIETAAAAAGIASVTFREWMRVGARDADAKSDTEFARFASTIAEAQGASEARIVVGISKASEDDWRAGAFLLERQFPKRWGSRQTLEHTGKDGGAIEHVVTPMTRIERLQAVHDELLLAERENAD